MAPSKQAIPRQTFASRLWQNEGGLRQYVDEDRLNVGLKKAAAELQYVPDSSRQIHFDVSRGYTWQGLYPRKHYPKAEYDTPAA